MTKLDLTLPASGPGVSPEAITDDVPVPEGYGCVAAMRAVRGADPVTHHGRLHRIARCESPQSRSDRMGLPYWPGR